MALNLPPGKRVAVSIGPDFDAHSVWMGTLGSTSQSHMSRGEFGALVGVPRLLDIFAEYSITTTWCVPTHTILTFRDQTEAILEAGHEVAAHGVWHEPVHRLDLDEERRLLELQIKQHEKLLGQRPRGYRSPALDHSDHTLSLLDEYGFEWDSSLQGRDFEPYHPRPVTRFDHENGNEYGAASALLEIPVSWYLDDFPEVEFLPRHMGIQSHDVLLKRWIDLFDFARENVPGGVVSLTIHPQSIGRGHHLLMLRRFIEHIQQYEDVWFPTLSEVVDRWTDDAG